MAVNFYPIPGVNPADPPSPINLVDLGMILKMMVKNPDVRTDMFKDPAATLARLNFQPNDHAIKFFQSMQGVDFDKAANDFVTNHPNPLTGMAEM